MFVIILSHNKYVVNPFSFCGVSFMYDLAKQFKKVRQERNLTQKQVAEGIGIAEQAYQLYEYGRTVPSATVLIALADYFDVSLDYLCGRSDVKERR